MNEHYANNATYLDSLKLCKDCKWCLVNSSGLNDARCSNPAVKTYLGKSLVTGEDRYELPFADNTRNKGKCGEEGRLFQQRLLPVPVKSDKLTTENCYERGFRWDEIDKRFV
jgi:hypothetical protein